MTPLNDASGPEPARRSSGDVTRLLNQASSGNKVAFDELVPIVYDELRRMANDRLKHEDVGHTLSPTALVHEAYLQLAAQDRTEWQSRAHFFAVAALAMRRILVSHARTRSRKKRGDGAVQVDFESAEQLGEIQVPFSDDQSDALIALDAALTQLRTFNEDGADIVQYRFFGGLQFKEIAEVMGVSEVTVRRRWTVARAWLKQQVDT